MATVTGTKRKLSINVEALEANNTLTLGSNAVATQAWVTSTIIDGAPAALNTLNELAAALNDTSNYATTVTNALGLKLDTSSERYFKFDYDRGSAWAGNTGGQGRNRVGYFHGPAGNCYIALGSSSGDLNLSVDGNIYVQEGNQKVATEAWVLGKNYLDALPSHNHDSAYWRTTRSVSLTGSNPFDDAKTETRVTGTGNYVINYTGASAQLISSATGGSASIFQIGAHYNGSDFYMRTRTDSTNWQTWKKLWHTGNFDPATKANASHNHSAANITSGTLDSARLSGTYNINVGGYSNSLIRRDNRTISPSEDSSGQLKFGFTSFNNNNAAPWADYLHLRSYTDSSGGNDNLLVFSKSDKSVRLYQQSYGSNEPYSSYVDFWTTGNFDPATKANASHNHDDRYYTESEVNTLLNGKAASSHNHDDRYYTETEVNTLLGGKANSSHTHDGVYQPAGSYAASNHNHTYDVNNAWLRDNGDNANVKLYGNTRQMVFRTDGTTEYASGVGGYPFAWMYGGDAATNRRMLLNSSGQLWLSNYGWLHDKFADVNHNHNSSYLGINAKAADSNLLDGLDLHTGRNNEANKVVRTDSNGYIQAGWINTTSGATTSALSRIYASNDAYLRYVTPTEFRRQITDGVYQPAGNYLTSEQIYTQLATKADASHSHNLIVERPNIQYGTGFLQWTDLSGVGGTGLSGSQPANPFNDWHHHIIMNHANGSGYYVDLAFAFHSDDVHFRRMTGGSFGSWREIIHSGNIGTQTVASANVALSMQWNNILSKPSSFTPSAHTHTTDEIVGLQAELDLKAGKNGGYGDNFYVNALYYDDWVRNHSNTNGIYWSTTGWHLYPIDNDDFRVRSGNTGSAALRFNTGGTDRNYVYCNSSNEIGFLSTGRSWMFKVTNTGTATATGDVVAFSDRRLKENIETIPNALEKVEAMRGVTFTRKDTGKESIGLIAQEVEEIIPEVVNNEGDYKGVAYGNLVGVLIEAVKELSAEVKELKAKLGE